MYDPLHFIRGLRQEPESKHIHTKSYQYNRAKIVDSHGGTQTYLTELISMIETTETCSHQGVTQDKVRDLLSVLKDSPCKECCLTTNMHRWEVGQF